jgi:hypothetical protein
MEICLPELLLPHDLQCSPELLTRAVDVANLRSVAHILLSA